MPPRQGAFAGRSSPAAASYESIGILTEHSSRTGSSSTATDDSSGIILEEMAMLSNRHGRRAVAPYGWDASPPRPHHEIAVWDRPSWVMRLKWCCVPSSEDERSNDGLKKPANLAKQPSRRPVRSVLRQHQHYRPHAPQHGYPFSQSHSHAVGGPDPYALNNKNQVPTPYPLEYNAYPSPYVPMAYSRGPIYNRYQQQAKYQPHQYPMTPLSPPRTYHQQQSLCTHHPPPVFSPVRARTASFETCSDLSMDASGVHPPPHLSPPRTSSSIPPPPLTSSDSKSSPTKSQGTNATTTTRDSSAGSTLAESNGCNGHVYPPPPLSPTKKSDDIFGGGLKSKKMPSRKPSKVARRRSSASSSSVRAPNSPPESDRHHVPHPHPPPPPSSSPGAPVGKPPLPPVVVGGASTTTPTSCSEKSLMVPPLNHSTHTATTHTSSTAGSSPLTFRSSSGGASVSSSSPSIPPPPTSPPSQGARVRIMSEFSRASIMTSRSRHLRQHHDSFEFSAKSLRDMFRANKNAAADADELRPEAPPCVFVEVKNMDNDNFSLCGSTIGGGQQRSRHYSWSSWDDEERYQGGPSATFSDWEDDGDVSDFATDDEGCNENHFYSPSADSTTLMRNCKTGVATPSQKNLLYPQQYKVQKQQHSLPETTSSSSLTPRLEKPPIVPRHAAAPSPSPSFTSSISSRRRRSCDPVYLPISPSLDTLVNEGRVVVSGWAAVSLDARIQQELRVTTATTDLPPLQRSDLAYVQLIQVDRSVHKLCIHRHGLEDDEHDEEVQGAPQGCEADDSISVCSKAMVDSLLLTRNFQVSSEEVGGRAGQCIVLRNNDEGGQVMCTMLPVSLPELVFSGNSRTKLVPEEDFKRIQQCLFTPFSISGTSSSSSTNDRGAVLKASSSSDSSCSSTCSTASTAASSAAGSQRSNWGGREYYRRRYAPDEQHDATRHLLFALDSAVRQSAPTFY